MDIKKFIVFEDKNLILINKPRGILSQQDGTNDLSLDKEVSLYLYNKDIGAHLINRLDKDTSGLIMFAKNEKSAKELSILFQDHSKVIKKYLTLVNGTVDNEDEIKAPLRKSFERKKMVVAPIKSGAKEAITRYNLIKVFDNNYSLVEVRLLTGRTHQIRAHFSYIRHHVIGDTKYGDYKINNYFEKEFGLKNQFLHSYSLSFDGIRGMFEYLNKKEFFAPLNDELKRIIDSLENKIK